MSFVCGRATVVCHDTAVASFSLVARAGAPVSVVYWDVVAPEVYDAVLGSVLTAVKRLDLRYTYGSPEEGGRCAQSVSAPIFPAACARYFFLVLLILCPLISSSSSFSFFFYCASFFCYV